MAKGSEKLPKFEEAVEELETIIEQIESGQAGLEDSITQYERGMKLIGRCQAILDKAQQRIAELTVSASGKPEIKEAELNENDDDAPEADLDAEEGSGF